MGAVAAILIGVFAVLVMRMTTPQMAPLFTGLAMEDSGAILRELDSAAVRYEIRGDGSTILVPRDDVARLRMRLAQDGLPSGGGVGYEIFDNSSTLGSTSFVQNVNHLRALEGELARSIRALRQVEAARVHLVLPERRLFSRETETPSASIVARVRGHLEPGQIRAMQHLVASAVPRMEPRHVAIVDEAGRLLAGGSADEDSIVSGALEERALAYERRLREEVQAIVESVVGPGRARVQVAAEIDRNRTSQTEENYDPESRVIRSTQTREEASSSNDAADDGVTVGNDLPNAEGQAAGLGGTREDRSSNEEIVNYEISRTTRTDVVEAGGLRRLSVAVLVDGLYERNEAGEQVYQPRAQEQLDRIAVLVRSAVGYSEARGDTVEIVNLRFAELPRGESLDDVAGGWFGPDGLDLMRVIELAVLAALLLLVLVLVVRPLLKRMLGAPDPLPAALPGPETPGTPALPASGAPPALAPPAEVDNRTQRMLEIAEMTGKMHAASIGRIGEMVDANPDDAVAIVRQWMQEAA